MRRLLASGSIKAYFATQGLSVALGILLAFIVGLSGPSKHDTAEPKAPDLSQPFPPGDTEAHEARLKEISDIRAETQARNAALRADLKIKLAAIEADRVKQQEDLKKSSEEWTAAMHEEYRVKQQKDREKSAKELADAEANLADLVKQQEDRAKTRNVVLPLPQATPGPLQDKESLKTKAAKPALPQAAKPALTQKERDQQIQRNLAKTRQAQGPDH